MRTVITSIFNYFNTASEANTYRDTENPEKREFNSYTNKVQIENTQTTN